VASSKIEPAPTKSIELILGSHEPDEAEIWRTSARTQAGLDMARLKVLGPAEPPATQADLVRDALSHDPRVLIVEAALTPDSPLAQTIDQARSQGVPVVLMGAPPTGNKSAATDSSATKTKSESSSGQKAPLVVVAPQPFAVSAKQLVAAALRNMGHTGLDFAKSAILVVHPTDDSFVAERAGALKEALKAAGITLVEEVRFTGDTKAAEKLITASLKAHPKTFLLFSTDSTSSVAIRDTLKNESGQPFFITACYTTEGQQNSELIRLSPVAAVAEFTPTRLLRKAVSTAVALGQEKAVAPTVEFRVNVTDSLTSPAVIRAQALNWKKGQEAAEKAKK
jgi:ABC-type sugar transport system substrate-binding protein